MIKLTVLMMTFEQQKNHPSHLVKVVPTQMTIYGVIELIKADLGELAHMFVVKEMLKH